MCLYGVLNWCYCHVSYHRAHSTSSHFAFRTIDSGLFFHFTAEHSKNFVRAILRLKKSFERRVTLSKPSKKQGGFEFNTPVIEVERSLFLFQYSHRAQVRSRYVRTQNENWSQVARRKTARLVRTVFTGRRIRSEKKIFLSLDRIIFVCTPIAAQFV